MSATNFAELRILDHLVGRTAWTMPTTHLALFTAMPDGEVPTVTEANYTGYARRATAGLWAAAAAGAISNSGAIVFDPCTAGSNTIVGWGLYDAATGGNLLAYGTCSLAVSAGITPQFAAGALTITAN